jgi:hypothetical protein
VTIKKKLTNSIPRRAARNPPVTLSKIKAKHQENIQNLDELPRAFLLVRWSEPVDQICDLVDAAIHIIEPAEGKEPECRRFVADGIQLMRMIPAIGDAPDRRLRQLMEACRKVTRLLAELPPSLSRALLSDPLSESDLIDEIRLGVPAPMRSQKNPQQTSRSAKLSMELESLAKAIEKSHLGKKRRGPKEDLVKLNAVQAAYLALIQYSSLAPTTTTAGPFYELSSIYYEAVTGSAGVSMERQCRNFLKSDSVLTN